MNNKIINESMRIAGKKVNAEKVIEVEYPFTGDVIGTVPAGNAEHAKQALDIAANFTPKLTRYERQKILQLAYRCRSGKRPSWQIIVPLILSVMDDADHVAQSLKSRSTFRE